MLTKFIYGIFFLALSAGYLSCSPRNISTNYYYENQKTLDSIEINYKSLYRQNPFTVVFTSRSFKTVAIEIITDTLSYIYEFKVDEGRLYDTLNAFHLK